MTTRTLLLTFTCLIFVGAAAHAEELKKPAKPEALNRFEAGKAQFKAGKFKAAAEEFESSLALEASPAAYYNGAQCYRTLAKVIDGETSDKRAHFQLAIWHFTRFLNTTTNTPEYAALANKLIAESIAERNALPKVEPVTPAPSTTVGPTTVTPTPSTAEKPMQPGSARSRWNDPLAWAFTGAGVVGLGAAGLLFWNASSLRDDANHTTTQTEVNALRDRADSRSLAGTIIGVGSGLILIVGIAKLAITDVPPSGNLTASARRRFGSRLTLALAVAPNGLSVSGHF